MDSKAASDQLNRILTFETCKMNCVDPHAWLTTTLTAIVNGHKQSKIQDLLPWNYAATV